MTTNPAPHGLRHGAATHIGLERETQEDAYVATPPLFGVADGVGGHAAGDVAAQTALEVLVGEVAADGALTEAIRKANDEIVSRASESSELEGMGTTITVLLAAEDGVNIAHVGDSRAYLLREGELRRLTKDHTMVERMVRQGKLTPDEAAVHPARSRIERALGANPEVKVDVEILKSRPGDRFLLCTDGLNGVVSDQEIQEILEDTEPPDEAAQRLVDAAVQAGGHDNITALVVDLPGERKTAAEMSRTKRRRRRLLASGIALLIVLLAGVGARAALQNSWYLGVDQGEVAVYRGIPGSIAGISLGQLERNTDLEIESVPPPYRQRVEKGLRVDGPRDADELVEELRSLSETEEPEPTP
jgi:serine/threonine protein phosphatase PrpC